MRCLVTGAAMALLIVSPALATSDAKPAPQPSLQTQVETLQKQVATLQKQVEELRTARNQPVCISFWCGTVISGRPAGQTVLMP